MTNSFPFASARSAVDTRAAKLLGRVEITRSGHYLPTWSLCRTATVLQNPGNYGTKMNFSSPWAQF